MRKFVLGLLLLSGLLTACNAATEVPPAATPAPTATPLPSTSTPEPACSAAVAPDFAEYASWTKVNPRPIKGHEMYVNVYVDELAKDIYLSASGRTFPVCSMIVKTHLTDADSDTVMAVTVMVKMPAGYDPENNDWGWGMYDKNGKVAKMSGKVAVCIACHKPAAEADFVFSRKVMEEISQ